ncbi:DUF2256 domain-containing protein [Maricaulis sp. CAU 1757]
MSHQNKPEKICAVCGRPFSWRRKWASVWDEVRYCSQRCRSQRHSASRSESTSAARSR